jgi:hypothetical protein
MNIQTVAARVLPAGSRKALRAARRHAFVVVGAGIGLFTVSLSAFGGDPPTGYATASAVRSHPASLGRRPIYHSPVDPPGEAPDRAAREARVVDQLYGELMRQAAQALGR